MVSRRKFIVLSSIVFLSYTVAKADPTHSQQTSLRNDLVQYQAPRQKKQHFERKAHPRLKSSQFNAHNYSLVGRFELEGVVIRGAAVPFVYRENEATYLYMCRGRRGHGVAISINGSNFSNPRSTGIGRCGLNFIPIKGGYRLYMTMNFPRENQKPDMSYNSSVVRDLKDFGPLKRTDEGIRFSNPGVPFFGFIGTPSVVTLPGGGARVYVSCGDPSSMASFSSPDGLKFGEADDTFLPKAIDPEVHDLEDGTFRAFFTVMDREAHRDMRPFKPHELMTAISQDGIHWEVEGLILTTQHIPFSVIADPSALKLKDGSWRIYFGTVSEQGEAGNIAAVRWWPLD